MSRTAVEVIRQLDEARSGEERAVATELVGDLGDRHLGVKQAEEGAAFVEGEVAVGQATGSVVQALAKLMESHFEFESTRVRT